MRFAQSDVTVYDRVMPYQPAERLLQLARLLAGTRVGLTLDELAAELGVTRRTAERMRDKVASVFPSLEHWTDEAQLRRWRLPGGTLGPLAAPRAEAVAAVEGVARALADQGERQRAELVKEAAACLRAGMRPEALRRAEPDIAALLEAEGLALRPGPRMVVADGLLSILRDAILGLRVVALTYRGRDGVAAERRVCPYGLLYGGRGWLVAVAEGFSDVRLWRLDRIAAAAATAENFARDPEFDLRAFARRSFGVFQSEPMDVVLRIAPRAAADAVNWQFHPDQRVTRLPDGAAEVLFSAGSMDEMCWHFFTWGKVLEIVAPDALRQRFRDLLAEAAHAASP
jgi:predicted DNA-binding transcriptional regulator YafY